ncbi:hypothetical protein PIB30_101180 [Stylosanthes scabra]|uniref:PB1-like domain-containing protein n=1 Tax=Stylosanthes scabra TaxID=79078 RepID=A0ABU6X0G5_9FABA|nr:hypothetical protein [Stylosanthes scabra]
MNFGDMVKLFEDLRYTKYKAVYWLDKNAPELETGLNELEGDAGIREMLDYLRTNRASKVPRICVDITQEPTHMRGIYHQDHFQNSRSHAYAWTSVSYPRIGVTHYHPANKASKSPHACAPAVTLMRGQSRLCAAQLSKRQQSSRICVDISQLPTHMRDPLPPSKASIKVTLRICASCHAYAWPITFMCSSAFQVATKLTHMRGHH